MNYDMNDLEATVFDSNVSQEIEKLVAEKYETVLQDLDKLIVQHPVSCRDLASPEYREGVKKRIRDECTRQVYSKMFPKLFQCIKQQIEHLPKTDGLLAWDVARQQAQDNLIFAS